MCRWRRKIDHRCAARKLPEFGSPCGGKVGSRVFRAQNKRAPADWSADASPSTVRRSLPNVAQRSMPRFATFRPNTTCMKALPDGENFRHTWPTRVVTASPPGESATRKENLRMCQFCAVDALPGCSASKGTQRHSPRRAKGALQVRANADGERAAGSMVNRARDVPGRDMVIGLLVVLPVRIELTTSPLPMGCSTTELRQRSSGNGGANHGRKRRDPCHMGEGGASAGKPRTQRAFPSPREAGRGWRARSASRERGAARDESSPLPPSLGYRLRSGTLSRKRERGSCGASTITQTLPDAPARPRSRSAGRRA